MLIATMLKTLKTESLLQNIVFFLEKQLPPNFVSNNKPYLHQYTKPSTW